MPERRTEPCKAAGRETPEGTSDTDGVGDGADEVEALDETDEEADSVALQVSVPVDEGESVQDTVDD